MSLPSPLTGAVAGLLALAPAAVVVAAATDPLPFPPTRRGVDSGDVRSTLARSVGYGLLAGLLYVPLVRPLVTTVRVPLFTVHGAVAWGVLYGLGLFGVSTAWLRFGAGVVPDQREVTQYAVVHLAFGIPLGLYVAVVGVP